MTEDPASLLRLLWNDGEPRIDDTATVPEPIRLAIVNAVNASSKSIRYVLPSQLLAKLADPTRHALALQARSNLPGSFDARSFCNRFIVPFDQENHGVLGGSRDPGVGNILRYPQIDEQWLAVGRRETSGGRDLMNVLTFAQEDAQENEQRTEILLRLTLFAIAERLAQTRIVYPRPNRISLGDCEKLIQQFLTERTGGRRLQAVAAALFDTIGNRFGIFYEVEAGHVNRADAAAGDVADLDCRDNDGRTVLSVEVKDHALNVREVQDTLRAARDRGVAEIIYLIRGGVPAEERAEYDQFKSRQFTAGHNVYEIEFDTLLHTCLILYGEAGRLLFLETVGQRIDLHGELTDRRAWQAGLQAI